MSLKSSVTGDLLVKELMQNGGTSFDNFFLIKCLQLQIIKTDDIIAIFLYAVIII